MGGGRGDTQNRWARCKHHYMRIFQWRWCTQKCENVEDVFFSSVAKTPKIKYKCIPFPLLLENTGCKNNKHFLIKSNYSQINTQDRNLFNQKYCSYPLSPSSSSPLSIFVSIWVAEGTQIGFRSIHLWYFEKIKFWLTLLLRTSSNVRRW